LAIVGVKLDNGSLAVLTAAAGTVSTYGVAFLVGTTTIAYLSTNHWIFGTLLSAVTLLCLWLTMTAFTLTCKEIKQATGTSFRNANLTNAQFDGTLLRNTDFRRAIGMEIQD
jgi:uncharacterized protein YjbI with pentapeptide repeats